MESITEKKRVSLLKENRKGGGVPGEDPLED
jgi:hypothetical protein